MKSSFLSDSIFSALRKVRIFFRRPQKWAFISVFIFIALFILSISFHMLYVRAPKDFPVGEIVILKEGMSLEQVAQSLSERNVVRSPLVFRSLAILTSGENSVQAGYYMFNRPLNIFEVTQRVVKGEFDIPPKRITIPEGTNVFELAVILDREIEAFDTNTFIQKARNKEGYLFPDTYFFAPGTDPEKVITIMEHTFWKKIDKLDDLFRASDKSVSEIIIMASIIEREAHAPDERRIISGILWKRIEEGMPLQVDAAFSHVNGRNSFTLTKEDLVSTSSPYNTYTYLGLPPGPIANPGLDAIEAALTPEESPYYFYLHGQDGNIYYGATFDDHISNRRQYLD